MNIEIYFATNRLSITTDTEGGFIVNPNPECGINRTTLLTLFESYDWITLPASSEQECDEIFQNFTRQFINVVAAGGVVERDDESILMIYRNGRWDLPKGHWEQGETIEECAVREVEEESGVAGVTLHEKICETIHAYFMRGKWEIKTTHWYAMLSNDPTPLTPQFEEGIECAEWISQEKVMELTTESFPTIREVLKSYYSASNKKRLATNLTL